MTQPIRVLLVEDDLDTIIITKQFLELQGGFVVDAVTHALDFQAQIAARDYDVFLLDYNLPDANGLDILRDLRARKAKTPAIMITGRGDEIVAAKTMQAGAAEYVVKYGDYLTTLPDTVTRVIERARLKNALDEIEARYRDLFEQANDGILVCDADGVILEANPILCRWTDHPLDSLAGQHLEQLMLVDRPDAAQDLCARLAREGSLNYEGTYRRRNGTTFPVEISAQWVPSRGKGRPAFLQFFVRDITGRREMQAEIIRRTRALAALSDITAAVTRSLDLKEVLGAALDGMLNALEIDCGAIFLDNDSPQLAAARGFSSGFAEGMDVLRLAQRSAAGPVSFSAGQAEAWASREGVRATLPQPLIAKGKSVGLLLLASRERDAFSPDECDFVAVNCDRITIAIENAQLVDDLQRSLEALRNAQTHLVHAARLSAVGELAAGVAHQISNPLSTIIADAQLLLKSMGPDHPGHISASAVFEAGWRAQRVVQRLLNFSRPDEGDYALTDVNQTIVNALDLVGAHLEQGGVDLRLLLAADLPQITAHAHQLEEVWINLLMNAREALSGHRPGVIALTSRLAPDHQAVEVEVADNGRGINKAERDQVFLPFFTTKGEERGNGLGLSVSRSIISNHGGEIAFQSQPGQGTTFVVHLPLTRKGQ